MISEKGTKENPWRLKTPPGTSEYTMYISANDGKEILVCTVGTTVLHYNYQCINDLHAMLKKHGDWMELGSADEQKPAKEGTVEAWGRSPENPVGGWYGLKKGFVDDSGCTFRLSWNCWDWLKWNITLKITASRQFKTRLLWHTTRLLLTASGKYWSINP